MQWLFIMRCTESYSFSMAYEKFLEEDNQSPKALVIRGVIRSVSSRLFFKFLKVHKTSIKPLYIGLLSLYNNNQV